MLSKTGMSKVCILTEAGLLNQKTTGDQAGLIRAILDLYTKSGADDFAGDEGYSNSENNIPILRAPALTLIQESTPDSFIKSLTQRDSQKSGELARMWIARFSGNKKYLNRNKRPDFSADVKEKMKQMIKFCAKEQGLGKDIKTDRPNIINIKMPEWSWEYSDYWVDMENNFKKDNKTLQRVMCTRAFIKSMKIMSVCAIVNSPDLNNVEITSEIKEWVHENVMMQELNSIMDLFTRDSTSDALTMVKNLMIPNIIRILKADFNSVAKVPRKELRIRGIFTHSNITQCLGNNPNIASISSDMGKSFKPKDGVGKLLDYMVDSGLLSKVPDVELPKRIKTAYQITKDFETMARTISDEKDLEKIR
jgi:hypothetical protein